MADTNRVPVQMNVRVPRSLVAAIDAARADTGISRDKWVAAACESALPATSQENPT